MVNVTIRTLSGDTIPLGAMAEDEAEKLAALLKDGAPKKWLQFSARDGEIIRLRLEAIESMRRVMVPDAGTLINHVVLPSDDNMDDIRPLMHRANSCILTRAVITKGVALGLGYFSL